MGECIYYITCLKGKLGNLFYLQPESLSFFPIFNQVMLQISLNNNNNNGLLTLSA